MSARNRLVSNAELDRVLGKLRELGVQIGAVDIRADGVTVYPPAQTPGNDFDRWQAQDANRDRAARR